MQQANIGKEKKKEKQKRKGKKGKEIEQKLK